MAITDINDPTELDGIFQSLQQSTTTVSNAAGAWNLLGRDITGSMTSGGLSSDPSSLQANTTQLNQWKGAGAQSFLDTTGQVVNWGSSYGGLLGSGSGQNGSIADVFNNVSQAMGSYYKWWVTANQNWLKFQTDAANYFNTVLADPSHYLQGYPGPSVGGGQGSLSSTNSGSASPGNLPVTLIPSYSEFGFTASAELSGSMPLSGGLFTLSQMTLTPQPTITGFNGTGRTDQPVSVTGTVPNGAVAQANQDQYMTDLRQELTYLGTYYTAVQNALPKKQTPLNTNVNGGNSPTQQTTTPAVPGGMIPTVANGGKPAPSPATTVTPAVGANSPTATPATGANGAATPTATGTTPTSLANAPTTATPSSLGTSVPTATPTVGSALPTTGVTGSALPTNLGGTGTNGIGTNGAVPIVPFTGSTVPTSDLGGGTSGLYPAGAGVGENPFATTGAGGPGVDGTGVGSEGLSPSESVLGGSGANGAEVGGVPAESALAAERGGQTPFFPMMPMSPMAGGQDDDRRRAAWIDEDEDVWAAGTDPAPAVIGGQI